MYKCTVYQSYRAYIHREYLMGSVQTDTQEVFLHTSCIVPDQGIDVSWSGNLPSFGREPPPSKLKGCPYEGGLRHTKSSYCHQIFIVGHRLSVQELQKILGNCVHWAVTIPAPDEDGEKFLVTECLSPT